MPPADRKTPKRAMSSESKYSLMEFEREFPDDEACLQWLWRNRYAPDGEHAHCPRCDRPRSFKRYETKQQRQSWSCTACGLHVHPTAGTIFHKSALSLRHWFYAMFLMSSTRSGISAKQLERELGVNYKTAHRILRLIRSQLMEQDYTGPLGGEVEVDETYMGGKARAWPKRTREQHLDRKTPVFGAVSRRGQVVAQVMKHARGREVWDHVHTHVLPASMLFTDDSRLYDRVTGKYTHRRIKHQASVYVDGDVHTQTIEGFFGLVKNGIRGTYHSVSKQWLQAYLNEYAWRYNHRDDDEAMFRLLLCRAAES
jgi:transposase